MDQSAKLIRTRSPRFRRCDKRPGRNTDVAKDLSHSSSPDGGIGILAECCLACGPCTDKRVVKASTKARRVCESIYWNRQFTASRLPWRQCKWQHVSRRYDAVWDDPMEP